MKTDGPEKIAAALLTPDGVPTVTDWSRSVAPATGNDVRLLLQQLPEPVWRRWCRLKRDAVQSDDGDGSLPRVVNKRDRIETSPRVEKVRLGVAPAPGGPPADDPDPPTTPAAPPRPPARTPDSARTAHSAPAADPAPLPAPETARLETPPGTPIRSAAGAWPPSLQIPGVLRPRDTGRRRSAPQIQPLSDLNSARSDHFARASEIYTKMAGASPPDPDFAFDPPSGGGGLPARRGHGDELKSAAASEQSTTTA